MRAQRPVALLLSQAVRMASSSSSATHAAGGAAQPTDMQDIAKIVVYLRSRLPAGFVPDVAIVCGSGLSGLTKAIEQPISVPYEDIPSFPRSTVAGHGSELVFGRLGGKRVVAQRGRFHFYEGYSMQTVTVAVRVFAALGARLMLATNAAGGVNPSFLVGDIMVIGDHISLPCLGGNHPLIGANDARFGPRFPAVNGVYNARMQGIARAAAEELGLGKYMRAGTYFHDSGPSYESPMEILAMRKLGGDAVGMSTVPEVIVAAHSGLAVLGLSLITNQCVAPGDTTVPPTHEEVLAATDQRASEMQALVAKIVERVPLADLPATKAAAVFENAEALAAAAAAAAAAARAEAEAKAEAGRGKGQDASSASMLFLTAVTLLTLSAGFAILRGR